MEPCRYPWRPDLGDGMYSNPVIHADYSDPDVIRVGDDLWMTSSSFQCTPGLPILHSRDLVNWQLVNHAIRRIPHESYRDVRPGCGIWAPALRYHAGKFWLFFPMPDEGIYVTTAEDPAGRWAEPWCLQEAKGWIDPCPFWDDDGRAYLIHAYAMSRSGLKERIHLRPMEPDGTRLLGDGVELFHTPHHLYLEGPKVHKIDGWYYILCPGGGVQTGWQVVFRARSLTGPYEEKVVLEQGSSRVNGPHQGALVDLPDGSWWFLHFQDCGPFGRIVHLQPVRWEDGWPVVGVDRDGNGIGEPVERWIKPVPDCPIRIPETTDTFGSNALGLQWQWNANHEPDWSDLTSRPGWLRLPGGIGSAGDLTMFPRFLGQKFPARQFRVSTVCDITAAAVDSLAGLAVVGGGRSFAIAFKRGTGRNRVVLCTAEGEEEVASLERMTAELAVTVSSDGSFRFEILQADETWKTFERGFRAREGGWIGARVGLFHTSELQSVADFSAFQFSAP